MLISTCPLAKTSLSRRRPIYYSGEWGHYRSPRKSCVLEWLSSVNQRPCTTQSRTQYNVANWRLELEIWDTCRIKPHIASRTEGRWGERWPAQAGCIPRADLSSDRRPHIDGYPTCTILCLGKLTESFPDLDWLWEYMGRARKKAVFRHRGTVFYGGVPQKGCFQARV